jgi:hypothetical protein
MRSKQEYIDLLEETVQYYSEDTSRRGKDDRFFMCVYITDNGQKCAVGRCMIEEYAEEFSNEGDVYELEDEVRTTYGEKLDSVMQDEYKGYSTEFWSALQSLHDSEKFWDDEGLTEKGEERVEEILNCIEQKRYGYYAEETV